MRRKSYWIIAALVALSAATLLRADDAGAPANMPSGPDPATLQGMNNYTWFIEHYSSVAKDSDAMGVAAVFEASDMMRGSNLDQQADFFNKMLFETHSRAVQRAVRMKLVEIYRGMSRPDQAMQQLQALITEQPAS